MLYLHPPVLLQAQRALYDKHMSSTSCLGRGARDIIHLAVILNYLVPIHVCATK
jgi:hypothetical protein